MSSNILWKSFKLCCSKFKCLPTVKFEDENIYHQKSLTTSSTPTSTVEELFSSSSAADSDSDTDCIPSFATVFASNRFFFSTPGSSNSIFEQMKVEVPSTLIISGGVAVQKYSPDPYADFHRSMQEMIEAHQVISWEFLHELLCCYLTLNPKHTHKFIVDAFADVIFSLDAPSETRRKSRYRRRCTVPPPVA
ncbi:hypothetical protein F511_40484 [Dorcoceras hygrometricum]|uniref:Transcription repressor n=1 Tax=Dorcoceras hygrometricum TaxID=472368 RepID=A0A2Z7A0C9_9LAMI|nr:hypothetical protein F511_46294 [Dorcoceras hygrometricum]KZV14907.1 hypothetical protein F511_40484 [Dorcoceras hygrometricum]